MTAADGGILEVDEVDFSYGHLQVLFGVSLHMLPGEALALLGTNGAGKSTILNVIAGLAAPARGAVRMNGDDITGIPAERLVSKGLVLVRGGQGVFPDMTVAENLDVQALTLVRGRTDVAAARELAYATFPRLAERLGQKAGSLSGGEQQQLALAKAVMLGPSILCIDELSLGLAPLVVEELLAIIRRIHERGTSILLVEQSLNIACDVCDRAVFLEKGHVRFEGPARELLERDDVARAVFLGKA
jgi:ABC-type branched-subunit amino acid transport system ATPase component